MNMTYIPLKFNDDSCMNMKYYIPSS